MSAAHVKVGPYGGNGGNQWDAEGSPIRLVKITIYASNAINSFSFQYQQEGKLRTVGPYGNNNGVKHEITFQDEEYLTSVSGTHGPFPNTLVQDCIRSLKFVTNLKTYGPYGDQSQGAPFDLPVASGRLVAFFGRSGTMLDAIGFYLMPV